MMMSGQRFVNRGGGGGGGGGKGGFSGCCSMRLHHGELLVCNGKRARRNSKLESSTVSRYGSVFDDAAQDDAYIASVSEYFQLGQLMGERVEYTAMNVIEKKMNEGLLLLEDVGGDPLYLVSHLSDFVEERKTHETFEEFMARTNRPMRSPDGIDAQNRVLDLVKFVETQRMRQKAERMSTARDADAAPDSTSSTTKQPKTTNVQKQQRRRVKRRRRGENSKHWREFRQLYGYGLSEIESGILLDDEEDEEDEDVEGNDDDGFEVDDEDEEYEEDNEEDENGDDDSRRGDGEMRMPEPHSVAIADRLEAVRSLSMHDSFDGRISRLADFGVVVSFACASGVDVDGVLYLPDCFEDADEMGKVTHPEDIFKIGDTLRVSIAEIDATTARLRLRLARGGNLVESAGELETVRKLCDVLRDADGVDGVEEGLVLDQYQNPGVSLQILMHDEDMCGGFELLMRAERLQQRIFIMTVLSREEVGKLIKQSFDRLR